MSKVNFVINASKNVLNEKTAAILIVIAKNNFVTSAQIRETLTDLNASSVNSNIGVLLKKGLVEKSDNGLVLTGEGMDIIMEAATLAKDEATKDQPKKERKVKQPKGATPEMEATGKEIADYMDTLDIAVKETVVNRSNVEVRLAKRKHGVRQIEVRRDGNYRVFAYNPAQEIVDQYKVLGAKVKESSKNFYIDIAIGSVDIAAIINVIGA
ncbi:MotA-like activator of middle period transcription [Serratia phage 92A1]|nr:MotA-like activator of middle period transcription [Serratia phage 92A1]